MENGDWAHMVNINGQNGSQPKTVSILFTVQNKNRIMFKTRKIYLTRKKYIKKSHLFGVVARRLLGY